MSKKLTTRSENYSKWYNELVVMADLAENSPVRGCMVIKPYGYAIWEKIQQELDSKFKETGHYNAYFPLFVPKSLFEAEEKNAKGFAKECAVVTHYRLKNDEENPGKLIVDKDSKLEEELIVRPTSEAIIWRTYKNWIQSYRDLPILLNQWANVVRWEMRTRLFLRTAEFLWQEGHTVHETKNEALEETHMIINLYKDFIEEYMAIPILIGEKSENERFPGAVSTFCVEGMMQDGKALQAGTSHFLGQNFSKASEIKYQNRNGKNEYAWTTSWGVSTRLIGGLIMTHADDDGMIMPPRLAPQHIVIIPNIRNEENSEEIINYCNKLVSNLSQINYKDRNIEVKIDKRDIKISEKTWSWIKKGVPIRLEIGMREINENSVFLARRDTGEKFNIKYDKLLDDISVLLDNIQISMFKKAKDFSSKHTVEIDNYEEFKKFFSEKKINKPEISGGFVWSHFCGELEYEKRINEDLGVTIRLIPFDKPPSDNDKCIFSGKKSIGKVLFSRSY